MVAAALLSSKRRSSEDNATHNVTPRLLGYGLTTAKPLQRADGAHFGPALLWWLWRSSVPCRMKATRRSKLCDGLASAQHLQPARLVAAAARAAQLVLRPCGSAARSSEVLRLLGSCR